MMMARSPIVRRIWPILACIIALINASRCTSSTPSNRGTVTFTNTQRFLFDVDGNQIDAYAAKINFFNTSAGGKYYLYGIGFAPAGSTGTSPLKSWSSVDLVNWQYEGVLGDVSGGRPHIIYNAASGKYLLWTNAGSGYEVATSDSPSSGFTYVADALLDPSFGSLIAADGAVESFGDVAYLASAELNFADPGAGSLWPALFQTMHLSPLTDDFTSTTRMSYNVTSAAYDDVDQQTESPDIFMRGDSIYVVTSNTCGYCDGSLGIVYRTDSIETASEPWSRDIISGHSCNGQVEGVFPLMDPTTNQVTYVWHSTTVPGGPRVGFSGHIFQPMQFNDDGSVQDLNCSADAQWEVPFTLGTGSPATGRLTEATDGSPRFADYDYVCDTDLFGGLYQTWTNSKTGTLKEVAVNIAAGGNTNDLLINVFKFSTVSDLQSFGYKYTLLGTGQFTADQLTQVFNTTTIYLDAPVNAGDKLGFSIAEINKSNPEFVLGNFAPYCHLEYTLSSSSDQVLLEQAAGQNSYRGKKGNHSPVKVRNGKGIKFFTFVE